MSPSLVQTLMLRKSDAALCAAVRDGHDAAFAAIVLRHRSALLRHCRSLLRDGHAEDAVQQTFIRALQALRSGTEVRELGPWLHRIARNVALNELSARGRHVGELSEEWEDRGRADEFERRAELRAALVAVDALPARQRIALVRSASGATPASIGRELGVSSVAARQLVHRARVTVRAAVNVFTPPPLAWLVRRLAAIGQRTPRAAAGAPASAAPLATKVAVVVVASASIAAPAAVIHTVLSHHAHPARSHRSLVAHRPADSDGAPSRSYAAANLGQPRPVEFARPMTVHVRRARKLMDRDKSASAPSRPLAAPARPASSPPPQPVGVSASSPGAPVGAGSGGGSSAQGPGATMASASGDGGSPSAGSGPIASASASGPTASSGS